MKKPPTFARSFSDIQRLAVFSDKRPLNWSEIIEISILAYLPESPDAPKEIAKKRHAFNTRVDTATYLSDQGLPAIIDSYDYEILKLQGRVD